MAGCRIVNASLLSAKEAIDSIADSYESAGTELIDALKSAISEMEGATKDAFEKFINGDVKSFIADEEGLPGAIKGMATLLEANRMNFEKIDQEIANSIGQ